MAELPEDSRVLSQTKLWQYWSSWIEEINKNSGCDVMDLTHSLPEWDQFINQMIRKGYFVELIGVNPQVRAAVQKYGYSIYLRAKQQRTAAVSPTQTDRQTDTELRIVVPEYNIDEGHNNADEEESDVQA